MVSAEKREDNMNRLNTTPISKVALASSKQDLQDTEKSEGQCVLNDLTGLSWGLKSMSLRYSH